MIPYYFL